MSGAQGLSATTLPWDGFLVFALSSRYVAFYTKFGDRHVLAVYDRRTERSNPCPYTLHRLSYTVGARGRRSALSRMFGATTLMSRMVVCAVSKKGK